jgi:hypothetical protein
MKTAYLNCSSGIAGDMFLSAFFHAGVSPRAIEKQLKDGLKIQGWKLVVTTVERRHLRGRRLVVKGDRHFSSPMAMRRLVAGGLLSDGVKEKALSILDRLIAAESRVHGVAESKVHFHELNSVDTLVDVVGSCLVLEQAKVTSVFCSPINVGRPAPAATEISRKYEIPIYSTSALRELATPTGVAIASAVVKSFGPMPLLKIEHSGYGAGAAETDASPNMLQVLIGTPMTQSGIPVRTEECVVFSTNIDDMDPRIYPCVIEKLLVAGAHDAWLTQVLMKKGRPGIVLSALCRPEDEGTVANIIFRETTTLGIRREIISRYVLERAKARGAKIAFVPGGGRRIKSEFDDARKSAAKRNIPLVRILA